MPKRNRRDLSNRNRSGRTCVLKQRQAIAHALTYLGDPSDRATPELVDMVLTSWDAPTLRTNLAGHFGPATAYRLMPLVCAAANIAMED